MATKEQMEKVKDIVVKLRYLECMDNIIYYDRWNNCPKDGFDYEGKVGAYLTELSNEKLTSKETKALVESLEGETAFDSDTDKGMVRYLIGKYKEAVQIPASLQGELNQANADGQLAWGKCYEADDFEREFGVHAFGNLEKNIKDMVSYMKKHESVFLKGDDLKLSWWKMLYEKWKWLIRTLFPFFENLVCFVPFFMMNNRTVGSEYFANLDPFLLYVLLFAIVYGQQQATFSAILAVAGYMFRQMYTRSSCAIQT